jgi:hypothetical protein
MYGIGNGSEDTPEQAEEMNGSLPATVHQEELLVTDISNFLRANRTLKSPPESANGFKPTTRNVFHTHKLVSSVTGARTFIGSEFQLKKREIGCGSSRILLRRRVYRTEDRIPTSLLQNRVFQSVHLFWFLQFSITTAKHVIH